MRWCGGAPVADGLGLEPTLRRGPRTMGLEEMLGQQAELLKRCVLIDTLGLCCASGQLGRVLVLVWRLVCLCTRSLGVEMDSDMVMMVNVGVLVVLVSLILRAWIPMRCAPYRCLGGACCGALGLRN